jgi:hypothetical protein
VSVLLAGDNAELAQAAGLLPQGGADPGHVLDSGHHAVYRCQELLDEPVHALMLRGRLTHAGQDTLEGAKEVGQK